MSSPPSRHTLIHYLTNTCVALWWTIHSHFGSVSASFHWYYSPLVLRRSNTLFHGLLPWKGCIQIDWPSRMCSIAHGDDLDPVTHWSLCAVCKSCKWPSLMATTLTHWPLRLCARAARGHRSWWRSWYPSVAGCRAVPCYRSWTLKPAAETSSCTQQPAHAEIKHTSSTHIPYVVLT